MAELAIVGGNSHMQVLEEGVEAEHNRLTSKTRRYDRHDFDKWFADYDALVEIPSYFNTSMVEAYAEDPDVKFLFTERGPDSWVRGFNGYVGGIVVGVEGPLMKVLKQFHATLWHFCQINLLCYAAIAGNTRPGDPGNEERLRRFYVEYCARLKRTIPPERMLVIRIEDGLGWEQICPWLGKEVPDKGVEYPKGVRHDEIKTEWLDPMVRNAMLKLAATVLVPSIAIGWGVWNGYGRR
jgi:hypothetical protein